MRVGGVDITDWVYVTALVVGLACLNVWPDVVGHGVSFAAAADGLASFTNGRVFFSSGMGAMMFVCALWPRIVSHGQAVLNVAVPACSSAATFAFAWEGGQWPAIACVTAFTIGAGYGWYLAQLLTQLSRLVAARTVLVVAAASLLLKTIADDGLGLLSGTPQVFAAAFMPLVMTACLAFTNRRGADAGQLVDLAEHPKLEKSDCQVMIALLMVNAVLHAVTRAFSNLGLWGEGHLIVGGLSWTFLLVVLLLVLAVAASMLRLDRGNLVVRFLPAFLLLLGGYFILDPQVVAALVIPDWLSESLTTALELFAHLLYWMIIITGVRALRLPPLRVIGMTVAVMDMTAVVLALFVQNFSGMNHLVVMAAMYLFVLILVVLLHNSGTADRLPGRSSDAFAARCRVVAEESGLTPREAEVFALLAEGRDRAYIQGELFITEATIKTHVQHIYTKLGVHGKQELIALVREQKQGGR